MSVSQFARGRTVYGNGSYAPTRGKVSAAGAQGYLKRELSRNSRQQGVSKWGNDGQSDTRSGVAARMLAQKNANVAKSGGGMQWGGQKKNPPRGGRPPGQTKPRHTPTPPGQTKPQVPGEPTDPTTTDPTTPPTTEPEPPPVVTVNDAGQLEMPYSADWSASLIENLGDFNSQLADIQSQRQQQALTYLQSNREAGLQYDDLKRSTLAGSAGAGTAFSSGYGLAVGNNARNYNNTINDLATSNSQFNASLDTQQAGIVANFNQQLAQDAMRLAEENAAKAGDLGYGDDGDTGKNSGKGKPGRDKSGKPRHGKTPGGKKTPPKPRMPERGQRGSKQDPNKTGGWKPHQKAAKRKMSNG